MVQHNNQELNSIKLYGIADQQAVLYVKITELSRSSFLLNKTHLRQSSYTLNSRVMPGILYSK